MAHTGQVLMIEKPPKAQPARAWALHARGLIALEIANALPVSVCTVFRYLAEGTASVQIP